MTRPQCARLHGFQRLALALLLTAPLRVSAAQSNPAHPSGLSRLVGSAPSAAQARELALFGRFIGDWRIKERHVLADRTWGNAVGEWNFAWILEGHQVQDLFVLWPPTDSAHSMSAATAYGTTIRTYDARMHLWHVSWFGAKQPAPLTFTARAIGSEIILENDDRSATPTRWIFSDISPGTFHWRSMASYDHGRTWTVEQTVVASRNQ